MLSELSGDAVRPLYALRISPTRAAFHDSFFCKPSSKAKTRIINHLLSLLLKSSSVPVALLPQLMSTWCPISDEQCFSLKSSVVNNGLIGAVPCQKVSCRVLLALMGKGSAWTREWSAHAILIIRATQ